MLRNFISLSGGMFNPMLATVLLGGCDGHTTSEHIAIYWGGASMGAVLAFVVYPKIKQFMYPPPKQDLKAKADLLDKTTKKQKSS